MPVVLFSDADLLPVVRAGAARAGHDPITVELPDADAPSLTGAAAGGAEVAVSVVPSSELIDALNRVRRLGGQALPILGLQASPHGIRLTDASRSLLTDPGLQDLNVPVPVIAEDAARRALWDQIRSAALEDRHHVVEVDGAPAVEEMVARALGAPEDPWRASAAGAAGVLAGRLAAANRRWRGALEP